MGADVQKARRVEPWPWAVGLALGSMISVSLTFFWIASRHPDAEVVSDSYVAGLQYNAELAERQRAQARGLSLDLVTTPSEDGVEVFVRVASRGERTPVASAMRVRRERPAEGGMDADFDLAPVPGGYGGSLPLPLPGRWRLVVTATVEGEPVREIFDLRTELGV